MRFKPLSLACILGTCCLLGVAEPGSTQLASTSWPKHFQGNSNENRTTAPGPANSLALTDTLLIGECSVPTVGLDGTIYVSTYSNQSLAQGSALRAYKIQNGKLVSKNPDGSDWAVDLSQHAYALSAPTIDIHGHIWMGGVAYDGAYQKAKLIRVDPALNPPGVAAVICNSGSGNSSAADCPPVIDSDGTVYVASANRDSSSGINASVSAFQDGLDASNGLIKRWEVPSGNNWPVTNYHLALQDMGAGGTHRIFVHAYMVYPLRPDYTARITRLDSDANTTDPTTAFSTMYPGGTTMGYNWISHPAVSASQNKIYLIDAYNPAYLHARSTETGELVNRMPLDGWRIKGVGVLENGEVLSFSPLKLYSSDLSSNTSTNLIGTAAPSIDGNNNWFVVSSDGSLNVGRNNIGGRTWLAPIAGKAEGEVTIVDGTSVLTRWNDSNTGGKGLALYTGS